MRNDKFFKHDASAADDEKLMTLISQEGMKGYGSYWILMEALRKQENLQLSYTILRSLAIRCRVRKEYLIHIIEDFGLFTIEAGSFSSPDMTRKMAKYQLLTAYQSVKPTVKGEGNALINSSDCAIHAREEDWIGKDLNHIVNEDDRLEEQERLRPYQGWEAWVDEMEASDAFMSLAGIHSGLGEAFIRQRKRIVELFRVHIQLQGKQEELMNLGKVQSYFSNFVAQGTFTNKKLRAALECERLSGENRNLYRFETLLAGQRTYLGHPIPNDAPPRPDAVSVWNAHTKKWTH